MKVVMHDFSHLMTGRKRDLGIWRATMTPVSKAQEMGLTKVLIRKGEFTPLMYLKPNRLNEIIESCKDYKMDIDQALSLRKQLLIGKK